MLMVRLASWPEYFITTTTWCVSILFIIRSLYVLWICVGVRLKSGCVQPRVVLASHMTRALSLVLGAGFYLGLLSRVSPTNNDERTSRLIYLVNPPLIVWSAWSSCRSFIVPRTPVRIPFFWSWCVAATGGRNISRTWICSLSCKPIHVSILLLNTLLSGTSRDCIWIHCRGTLIWYICCFVIGRWDTLLSI